MTDAAPEWIKKAMPRERLAQAKSNPDGFVFEIDGSMIPDGNGYIPPEAIFGAYEISKRGKPTGRYRPNPRYGPILNDWSLMGMSEHWFGWMIDEPPTAIGKLVSDELDRQQPGSLLEWFKVTKPPAVLTGGPPSDHDNTMTVRRAAAAIQFQLSVLIPVRGREFLGGTFTWVATNLDKPGERRDRTWFDFGRRVDEIESLLESRIFELDAAD